MTVAMLLGIWKGVGWNLVVFLAALQSVPGELYESAEMGRLRPVHEVFLTSPCPASSPPSSSRW